MYTRLTGVTCIALLTVSSTTCSLLAQDAKRKEDCLPYDPAKLKIVDEVKSGWVLTDGRSRMLILDNERDAKPILLGSAVF